VQHEYERCPDCGYRLVSIIGRECTSDLRQ
jgi:hypothetical protein